MIYHVTASVAMAKDFFNEVILADDPSNTMYIEKTLTVTEIQACISPFTSLFEKKSSLGFAQWCSKNKLKLCEAEKKRKKLKGENGEKRRLRTLYVLHEDFHGRVLICWVKEIIHINKCSVTV